MNKRRIQPPIVGGSSLLVIFAVLCLTVFALLGFSTVQADMRLSDASAEAVSEYYQAELQAETILAEIRLGKVPEGVTVKDEVYTYSCGISDTQELQAEIHYDGKNWKILRWQSVSTADWEEENTLSVWNGN